MTRYIIIGSGAAGVSAAAKIRSIDAEGSIRIYNGEDWLEYYRPRLPDVLSGDVEIQKIYLHDGAWYQGLSIELRQKVKVESINTAAKTVTTTGGETVPYDKLLIATGSNAAHPPISGSDQRGVFTFRSADDAYALKAAAMGKKRAVMIGGGLLALEVAVHLGKLGLTVEVIEIMERLLPRQLDAEGAGVLTGLLEKKGLTFHLGRKTSGITNSDGRLSVTMDNGESASGDLVVICAGVVPETALAKAAGITVNRGIAVDSFMRTSVEGVWAAGDCAEYQGRNYGLWTVALDQGSCAGADMAGQGAPVKAMANTAKLKISGIDLVSSGVIDDPSLPSFTYRAEGVYRRLYVKDGKAAGVILFGDVTGSKALTDAVTKGADVSAYGEEVVKPGFEF